MNETIFDKILAKQIPADIVYEDDWALAFRDITPQAPVHVLVIPKSKVARFADLGELDSDTVGQFFKSVGKAAEKLRLDGNGYRVVINNGKDAQQTVEYLHAHILGGRGMSWPPG